jgi:hypothetical protein
MAITNDDERRPFEAACAREAANYRPGRIVYRFARWRRRCRYCGEERLLATDGRMILCSGCKEVTGGEVDDR